MKLISGVALVAAFAGVVSAHAHAAETHENAEPHIGETAEDLNAKWGIDVRIC